MPRVDSGVVDDYGERPFTGNGQAAVAISKARVAADSINASQCACLVVKVLQPVIGPDRTHCRVGGQCSDLSRGSNDGNHAKALQRGPFGDPNPTKNIEMRCTQSVVSIES